MQTLFEHVLNPLLGMSITAAFVAIVVILLRAVLKNRAPKQVVCLLWLLVFARLLVPVMVESPFSLVPTDLENIVRTEQSDVQEPAAPTQPVESIGPVSTNAPVVEVPPATIPGNVVTQPVGPTQSQPVTDPIPSEAPPVMEPPAEESASAISTLPAKATAMAAAALPESLPFKNSR